MKDGGAGAAVRGDNGQGWTVSLERCNPARVLKDNQDGKTPRVTTPPRKVNSCAPRVQAS